MNFVFIGIAAFFNVTANGNQIPLQTLNHTFENNISALCVDQHQNTYVIFENGIEPAKIKVFAPDYTILSEQIAAQFHHTLGTVEYADFSDTPTLIAKNGKVYFHGDFYSVGIKPASSEKILIELNADLKKSKVILRDLPLLADIGINQDHTFLETTPATGNQVHTTVKLRKFDGTVLTNLNLKYIRTFGFIADFISDSSFAIANNYYSYFANTYGLTEANNSNGLSIFELNGHFKKFIAVPNQIVDIQGQSDGSFFVATIRDFTERTGDIYQYDQNGNVIREIISAPSNRIFINFGRSQNELQIIKNKIYTFHKNKMYSITL